MVSGSEPEILISSSKIPSTSFVCAVIHGSNISDVALLLFEDLVSPEGLAVDVQRRLMFWVDSSPDIVEVANLDGSERRTLFDTDLVNPRAIIVVSSKG